MWVAVLLSLMNLAPVNGNISAPSFKPISDSLTVYIFLIDDCLISQYYTPELSRLHNAYHTKKVGFIGYFPIGTTTPQDIDTFAVDYRIDFPLKKDHKKTLVEKFSITVAPEVAVWDHGLDRLIYRGRIDDSYVRVGKRKQHPQSHDLEDLISAWIAGGFNEPFQETQAIGCFINFDNNRK